MSLSSRTVIAVIGALAMLAGCSSAPTSEPDPSAQAPDGDANIIDRDAAEAIGRTYLGLSEEEAVEQAESDDRPLRVGARDGQELELTDDQELGRVTIEVSDGVVTGVTVEYDDGEVVVSNEADEGDAGQAEDDVDDE